MTTNQDFHKTCIIHNLSLPSVNLREIPREILSISSLNNNNITVLGTLDLRFMIIIGRPQNVLLWLGKL
jgi:hypothetical protein